MSLAYLPGHYRGRLLRDDLQSMVRTIISQARPGDVVLLDSGSRYPVFLYDYERVSPGAARPAFDVVTRADARLRASESSAGWIPTSTPTTASGWPRWR